MLELFRVLFEIVHNRLPACLLELNWMRTLCIKRFNDLRFAALIREGDLDPSPICHRI